MTATKITPCLWYDGTAEEAANFYAATFPDSRVDAVHRSPADNPSTKAGDVLTVEFTVLGMRFVGLNGGPAFTFDEAVSFMVHTDDQAETDRYWNAIIAGGGSESMCGWCQDKWGLRWQITPRKLLSYMASSDRAASKRAMEAMMTMRKIDIAAIDAAYAGEPIA
jgi:2-polyprenyl-6-hydroxyphenyl methylase/3-demethylubiquinone-9 3-methyltransferase